MGAVRVFSKILPLQLCRRQLPCMHQLHDTPSYVYTDIAKTVNKFINAAFYGTWSKANLTVSTTTPTELFVDGNTP